MKSVADNREDLAAITKTDLPAAEIAEALLELADEGRE